MIAGGLSTLRRRALQPEVMLLTGLLALAIWIVLLWTDAGPDGYLYTGDSNILLEGTHEAFHCFRFRQFTECGLQEGTRHTLVGPFAPLQYIPSAILLGVFRVTDISALQLLARINSVAFVGSIVLAALPFRRNRRLWPLVVVAVAFSAASFQATSAFGEMLAAFALVSATVAAIERRPVLLAITCFFAALSKETLPPFLLLLVLAAAHDNRTSWRPNRKILIASVVPTVAALVVMAAVNVFRFGSITNSNYLDPRFRTPGFARQLDFAVGLWLSPNAGIAVFWPIATCLLAATALVTVRVFIRRADEGFRWLALATILGVGVAVVGGLARWYAPFGWITYGPRLAAPILPALVVAACKQAEPELTAAIRRFASVRLIPVLLAAACAILAIPQATAPWSYSGSMESLTAADSTCPSMYDMSLADTDRYYDCAHHYMWRTRPSSVWSAVTDRSGVGAAAQVIGVLAAAALTYGALSRRSVRLG